MKGRDEEKIYTLVVSTAMGHRLLCMTSMDDSAFFLLCIV